VTDSSSNAFATLKSSRRKRTPLSFTDVAASLAAAQKATGFVDTLAADGTNSLEADGAARAADKDGSATDDMPPPMDHASAVSPTQHQHPQTAAASHDDASVNAGPSRRKGRVRAPFVQCNLKIPEELRDALHLQALRERRTIAEIVTEVMGEYLTRKGTFDRLR
jgi:hypothetical protein